MNDFLIVSLDFYYKYLKKTTEKKIGELCPFQQSSPIYLLMTLVSRNL